MKSNFIYCITCIANGKVYVGSTTTTVGIRYNGHKSLLRKGRHKNRELQDDFDKFGEGGFNVRELESCALQDLAQKEAQWCVKLHAHVDGVGYNVIRPPSGGKVKSNRTKVFYRRIPDDKDLVELMDKAILEAAKSSFKVSEWLKREYGVTYGSLQNGEALKQMAAKDQPVPQMAVKAKETPFTVQFAKQVELDSDKKLVKDLLNDNERLSKEVAEFKEKELNWMRMDASEQLEYVVKMLTECRAEKSTTKTNPYDQTTND